MNFVVLTAALLALSVPAARAIGRCNFNGVEGECLTRAQCSGVLTPYRTPGVDDGCKPYATGAWRAEAKSKAKKKSKREKKTKKEKIIKRYDSVNESERARVVGGDDRHSVLHCARQ